MNERLKLQPTKAEGSNIEEITTPITIGGFIRARRLSQGYTLTDVAFRGGVGCSKATLSKVENGRQIPSPKLLNRLGKGMQWDEDTFEQARNIWQSQHEIDPQPLDPSEELLGEISIISKKLGSIYETNPQRATQSLFNGAREIGSSRGVLMLIRDYLGSCVKSLDEPTNK